MNIGQLIRFKRKAIGLTQAEAARRCGFCQQLWGAYERSSRKPKIETLQKIAACLNCDINELLDDTMPVVKNREQYRDYGYVVTLTKRGGYEVKAIVVNDAVTMSDACIFCAVQWPGWNIKGIQKLYECDFDVQ